MPLSQTRFFLMFSFPNMLFAGEQQSDLVALLSCFGQVEKIKMFSGQVI